MIALNRAAPLLSALLFVTGCRAPRPTVTPAIDRGWNALVLRSRAAEAVIVPAIGRVMQLALLDAAGRARSGPFWSNPQLGPGLAPNEDGWINHGGDKAWPAPQEDWPRVTGRAWPPPRTFDATPFAAEAGGGGVELASPIDHDYGVRVRRAITLDPSRPVMTIETTYEKVAGPPVRVAVWSITQLVPPDRMFVRLPARSAFPEGHRLRLPAPPRDLRVEGRLLSLASDPTAKTMISSDGDALLWIGEGIDLLIERVAPEAAAREAAPEAWPDGVHAQVYTNPAGPAAGDAYVELELLGPLRELRTGDHLSLVGRYTLIERREADPLAEARRVLGVN